MLTDTVRGAALRPFVTWYADRHGRAGLDRALSNLSPPDRLRFDRGERGLGISTGAWYPAPVIHPMLDGLLDGLDEGGRWSLAQSGADHTLDSALNGFLGVFFRAFVSPRICAFAGPRMWSTFYGSGDVSIASNGRRAHVMTVRNWSGHHDFLCQVNSAAGRAIYRAAGCRQVTTEHAACIGRGDRDCTYVIRW